MYFLRARYLEVNRNRFWSQDENEGDFDEPLTLHKYLYSQNNPITNIDPSGFSTIATFSSGIAFSEILKSIPIYLVDFSIGKGTGKPLDIRGPNLFEKLCDSILNNIFGTRNATLAAGTGFEPKSLEGGKEQATSQRDHLISYMHLYGSIDGKSNGSVYLPKGGEYLGQFDSTTDSYLFYYKKLGKLSNVTLLVAHITGFVNIQKGNPVETGSSVPNGHGSIYIGLTGGNGGGDAEGYKHAHLSIFPGRKSAKEIKARRKKGSKDLKGTITFAAPFCF